MKLICLGDSITKGIRPGVTEEQTFEHLLACKFSEAGIEVKIVNSGIGSETTALALERFARDIIDAQPDYVTIMYGTNDAAINEGCVKPRVSLADYAANLRSMVSQAKAAGIKPILMTPIPLGAQWSYSGHSPYREHGTNCVIKDYVEAVRRIASEENIPLVDNHAAWWQWESETGLKIETLQTDSCHPNPNGHELISETTYGIILQLINH